MATRKVRGRHTKRHKSVVSKSQTNQDWDLDISYQDESIKQTPMDVMVISKY